MEGGRKGRVESGMERGWMDRRGRVEGGDWWGLVGKSSERYMMQGKSEEREMEKGRVEEERILGSGEKGLVGKSSERDAGEEYRKGDGKGKSGERIFRKE
jgi:hypothetical protein